MHTTCVKSNDNGKSNNSDYIFVIRENTRLKHRCPNSHIYYIKLIYFYGHFDCYYSVIEFNLLYTCSLILSMK